MGILEGMRGEVGRDRRELCSALSVGVAMWVGGYLPVGTDQGVVEEVSVDWMLRSLLRVALDGTCEALLPSEAGCVVDMA